MSSTDKSAIWFAVINVYAASNKASKLWSKAEERMKAKGMVFHGSRTGKGGNAMELTFDACMAGYRRFIAVGGDGTVHDVLNGIAGFVDWTQEGGRPVNFSDFTIGVIPVGSGNDWIKTAGVPKDVLAAVDVLEAGCISSQDVVRVSMLEQAMPPRDRVLAMSYMMNVGGVGIDARVCEAVNAQKRQGKRGKILYVTSLIKAISERVPSDAKVICDGETVFDGRYFSMAFGVGKYSGGGMRQTPDAVMDDGLLDMTIIPELGALTIATKAPQLFTGTFSRIKQLVSKRGTKIEVIPDNGRPYVEVDGEVIGIAPVCMEIMGQQINVLTIM